MKILIPKDYLYKGAPEQTLEVNREAILKLNPETAWDEHIAKEKKKLEEKDAES